MSASDIIFMTGYGNTRLKIIWKWKYKIKYYLEKEI